MSRFTFVSGKIKNLKINSEPVKFNDILINVKTSLKEDTSAYCKDESEIYKKLKLLTSGCRLNRMLDKMGKLGWLWLDPYADEDEYGNVIPGTFTDGKHCKMIECVFNADLWQEYAIEEGAFYTNTKIKRRK
jgi:hypothetical protein